MKVKGVFFLLLCTGLDDKIIFFRGLKSDRQKSQNWWWTSEIRTERLSPGRARVVHKTENKAVPWQNSFELFAHLAKNLRCSFLSTMHNNKLCEAVNISFERLAWPSNAAAAPQIFCRVNTFSKYDIHITYRILCRLKL